MVPKGVRHGKGRHGGDAVDDEDLGVLVVGHRVIRFVDKEGGIG